jgi:hypothetical protein
MLGTNQRRLAFADLLNTVGHTSHGLAHRHARSTMRGLTFAALAAASTAPGAHPISPIPARVGSQGLQCSVYALAAEFGLKVQPNLTPAQKRYLADAATLAACTNNSQQRSPADVLGVRADAAAPKSSDMLRLRPRRQHAASAASPALYVDAVHGADTNAGSIDAPLKTIPAALALTRQAPAGDKAIILRGGTFYLDATIELGPADQGLTIQGYDGEVAEISGAQPVDPTALKWEQCVGYVVGAAVSLLEAAAAAAATATVCASCL